MSLNIFNCPVKLTIIELIIGKTIPDMRIEHQRCFYVIMQFNELKATVMDYIWLIRDSLYANNAIYFQLTIFTLIVCKIGHISWWQARHGEAVLWRVRSHFSYL